MRELTSKQKKSFLKAVGNYCELNKKFPLSAEDLDEYDEIESMNPTEIFWQEAIRFVDDLYFSGLFPYKI